MKNILYRKPVTQLIAVISGIYVIYYLWWRVAFTLNESAVLFSVILLAAELMGTIEFFLFAFMTWNTDKNKKIPPIPKGATVDVFVPTYNEDLKILKATLVGCLSMNHSHTTYILDDGHRPEVERLAHELGCGYLTRENNQHAKAGNINAALGKTSGEFIVILDADMVPQPDFIEKTLGYFSDRKTAIVQLPQEFYNVDSAQHQQKAADWHEQQLFYHVIQNGKNNINASFWCGSPSIVRRAALESIGGVATESITEDFLTSIKLNTKGWTIKYHHEVLAFGIAPQSIHAFNLQRLRWAQGAMKILKSRYNPLIAPKLTLAQRLSHFSAIFTYFSSYQKLIYILAPSIYLLTGAMPVKPMDGLSFLTHWLPYFILIMLANISLGRGYYRYLAVEKFNTIKMFTFIRASFTLFLKKKLVFQVTPKTVERSIRTRERRELRNQLLILAVILLSVLFGAMNSIWDVVVSYSSAGSLLAAFFWALFNSFIIILALRDVFKRLFNRQDYRFPLRMMGSVEGDNGHRSDIEIFDISQSGLGFTTTNTEPTDGPLNVRLHLPDGFLDISGTLAYNRPDSSGGRKIGMKFNELPLEEEILLYKFLYVTLPRRLFRAGAEDGNQPWQDCRLEFCKF